MDTGWKVSWCNLSKQYWEVGEILMKFRRNMLQLMCVGCQIIHLKKKDFNRLSFVKLEPDSWNFSKANKFYYFDHNLFM